MNLKRFVPGSVGVCIVIGMLPPGVTHGSALQRSPERIVVWDTGSPSPNPWSSTALAEKVGWEQRARNTRDSPFRGDAVISNGRILAVLRRNGSAVEVYATASQRTVFRAGLRLHAIAGESASRLEHVALIEHTRSAARLEARYATADGATISARFRLKRGGIFLETEPGDGAGRLRVEAPGPYVVLPDFFADDILIDASKVPVSEVDVPSENFLLHLIPGGDAIAMCVFENREQDVKITLAERDGRRIITGSDIHFGKGRKIWLALLEGRHIWHMLDIREEDAERIMPLDWKMPFAAQWRVDFTRRNELTDSWEMLIPAKNGAGFVKPSWLPSGPQGGGPSLTATGEVDVNAYQSGGPASERLAADRKRWTTVLGRFRYPCWLDSEGRGYIQPLKHRKMMFRGPAVIYPINRLPETPTDTYTVVDVIRDTLGVGPCEYILDLEGQGQKHVGRATCHVRTLLNEIYTKKQQRAKPKEIETYLGDGLDFVTHIRGRITHYVQFGREIREYFADQQRTHPEMREFLTEMDGIAQELDLRLAQRREEIKTPEFVSAMNDEFRRDLKAYEGSDVLVRLKAYTDALTKIGGNQDELVGECRWIVRTLRQRAGIMMAMDPRYAEIATEIRARTQKVLLKPAAYEGARH